MIPAIGLGSLLLAMGSSGSGSGSGAETKAWLARFLLEYPWPTPGTVIRIGSSDLIQGPNMVRMAIETYSSDPDWALDMTIAMLPTLNAYLIEGLLNETIPLGRDGTFTVPRPEELLVKFRPRPKIFGVLRSYALVWRDMNYDEGIYEEGREADKGASEEIADKATWILEWLRDEATPSESSVAESRDHLEYLLANEQNPIVDPDSLLGSRYQEAVKAARDALTL